MSGPSVPALEGALAPTLFKIINGSPTPEELAAVAALVAALAATRPTAGTAGPAAPAETGPAARWDHSDILPPTSWAARA
ncbi:acyl-CoA carboxylase epsilon subunit [Streptomyces sp. NPDC059874]|uniref:acyl-CoA carboxylase epsilon subunit n=1 Tax=Streptomyces sp. NPDC059874 TaxID=3346983 RepID=UPI00365E0E77